jgi:hypothetical protein
LSINANNAGNANNASNANNAYNAGNAGNAGNFTISLFRYLTTSPPHHRTTAPLDNWNNG